MEYIKNTTISNVTKKTVSNGMKILRITSLGYEDGGAENSMVLLKPVLEGMGHTVKVFSSDAPSTKPHFSDFECRAIESQPFLLRMVYRAFYPHAYRALKKVLEEYKPDIVQLHTMYALSPSVLFLLRKYPTIATVHGAEEYVSNLLVWAYPRSFFKKGTEVFETEALNLKGRLHFLYNKYVVRLVYRQALKNVDTFLVMSKYMQEKLREEGIESVCIPNATQLLAEKPIDVSKKNILYVGRLEKIKGVQYLLQAMPTIFKEYGEATLTVVGSGEYQETLEKLATDLNLGERVQFLGHKNRDELALLYGDATLLVVPSVWPEPFGKVGIEAMSVGRPVIACDVGGISEWLEDGVTGYLIPPRSPSAIAEKVLTIFKDKDLLLLMSLQAGVHARAFSIESYATHVVDLYTEVLAKHASNTIGS